MRPTALLLVPLFAATARTAAAYPPTPPDEEPIEWREDRAFLEWSTWVRVGYGVESTPLESAARSTQPPPTHDQHTMWDAALGADVTLPLPTPRLRLGPWAELSPQGWFAGGEVSYAGGPLGMFWYKGEHVYTVRAGANPSEVTAAIAYGYRCPWRLWGPYDRSSRYMIGVRLVASATRSIADPADWSMTIGLEFEPLGSLRYLGGIRSWY